VPWPGSLLRHPEAFAAGRGFLLRHPEVETISGKRDVSIALGAIVEGSGTAKGYGQGNGGTEAKA
jgi:hypothetical protein